MDTLSIQLSGVFLLISSSGIWDPGTASSISRLAQQTAHWMVGVLRSLHEGSNRDIILAYVYIASVLSKKAPPCVH